MHREVPGGGRPLQSWERWYWGAGIGGVGAFLFWRLRPETKTPELEDVRRREAELEARRRDHIRAVLAAQGEGGFVAEGDDPLDGLSPQQIEELVAAAGIDPRDPLEGMTPEEIDEYVRRQEEQTASRRTALDGGGGGTGS